MINNIEKNEIDHYLIPLKYKVRENQDVFVTFVEIFHKVKKQKYRDAFSSLIKKNGNNSLTTVDRARIEAVVNVYRLAQLRKEKKKNLGEKFEEEAIQKREWVTLQSSITNPIYAFQELYFEYSFKKKIVDIFGKDLAQSVEEIHRDGIITEVEKDYVVEKAAEMNISLSDINTRLLRYESESAPLESIVYEICKDGIVTDVEEKYLCEKAVQYGIRASALLPVIENVLSVIKKIQKSFENPNFYNCVQLLFLNNFFEKIGFESELINKLYCHVNGEANNLLSQHETTNFLKQVLIFVKRSFRGVDNHLSENLTAEKLFSMLGVTVPDISSIFVNNVNEVSDIVLETRLEQLFEQNVDRFHPIQTDDLGSTFTFGGEKFEFMTASDKNSPLFCFDVIGDKTIITVNKEHYFYKDTMYFKLLIITFVNNLKRNYADEHLVEEIQHLLNPPANIRINYLKPHYEVN